MVWLPFLMVAVASTNYSVTISGGTEEEIGNRLSTVGILIIVFTGLAISCFLGAIVMHWHAAKTKRSTTPLP